MEKQTDKYGHDWAKHQGKESDEKWWNSDENMNNAKNYFCSSASFGNKFKEVSNHSTLSYLVEGLTQPKCHT